MNHGEGGALKLECMNYADCSFTLENNSFGNNEATYNGGAIAWKNIQPAENGSIFNLNKAMYGADISSYAVKLRLMDIDGNLVYRALEEEKPAILT